MPELAEVEHFRKQWDAGLRQEVRAVKLHGEKRIFRGSDPEQIAQALTGARLLKSEARGKQMLFHFSGGGWLGLHLGMTGAMRTEKPGFEPEKHDHLVLEQKKQTLVFRDARLFGRVRFSVGPEAPEWWRQIPPALSSPEFTVAEMRAILKRRARAPLKALLLVQEIFPGVGNWMADEILWQARLHPRSLGGALSPAASRRLWSKTQEICRVSLETIGNEWGDPPADWLIHVRWKKTGQCPKHHRVLSRDTIGGRTTAWCAWCQPEPKPASPASR
jgi:formamidopyrimidine-DNA glycosylase